MTLASGIRLGSYEIVTQIVREWLGQIGVKTLFTEPASHSENGYIESFNGTFRAECLNTHWFTSLTEAQRIVEPWRGEYNESRPHRTLGEKTPTEFAKETAASRDFLVQQTAENSP